MSVLNLHVLGLCWMHKKSSTSHRKNKSLWFYIRVRLLEVPSFPLSPSLPRCSLHQLQPPDPEADGSSVVAWCQQPGCSGIPLHEAETQQHGGCLLRVLLNNLLYPCVSFLAPSEHLSFGEKQVASIHAQGCSTTCYATAH